MHPISEVAARELAWLRLSARPRAYELRADGDAIATLRWRKGTLAEAASGDGRWTFKRVGFWRPRVTVRAEGSGTDLAILHASWTGSGLLELPGGRAFRWNATNFWRSQWAWQDAGGQPLAFFKGGHGRAPVNGRVEIAPAAAALPDLPLLVLLGWYLLVLRAQDESDSAGATAAVVASASVVG